MKKIRFLLEMFSLLVFFLVSVSVSADSPAPEKQYIEVAPGGQYFFVMLPADVAGGMLSPAQGQAYQLTRIGSFESLWKVEGWYASSTFLTRDGRYLVRMGPWASAPPEDELAVAFYEDGVEHTRYSVADLLDDTDSIKRSVSHYLWQAYTDGFPRLTSGNRFQLLTIEGMLITFDAATGQLMDRKSFPN
jgi:hypothetical protein